MRFDGSPKWWRRLRKGGLQRGLILAVIECAVCGAMLAAMENWLVPVLQLRLHASPFLIGLMAQIPFFGLALLGPVTGVLIRRMGGNKKASIITAAIQVVCLFGFIFPVQHSDAPWALPVAAICLIGFGCAGAINGTSWFSWMSDLIPRRIRGRYWGNRAQIMILAKLLFALGFAFIIRALPMQTQTLGIVTIFALAAISRLISVALLRMQHERIVVQAVSPTPLSARHLHSGGIIAFLRTSHRTDLGRWTLIWSVLMFGVCIAGPFFQVYMLSAMPIGLDLGDKPLLFTVLVQMRWITSVMSFAFAGRLIDLFGAAPLLRISIIGATLVPFVWACTSNIPILIVAEIFSGIVWGTAECALYVLLLSCSTSPDRARLIGFHSTVVAYATILGTAVGGSLLKYLPDLTGSHFHSLFLLSGILRVPAIFLAVVYLPVQSGLRIWPEIWRQFPGVQPTISASRRIVRFFRG
jgi:MFS family permease